MTRLLIVNNDLGYLLNFRGRLLADLVARGVAVTVAGPPEQGHVERLKALGVAFTPWGARKAGRNPVAEARAFLNLIGLIRRLGPDIVFASAVKPVIHAMIAAGLCGVPRKVALITGLGYAFTEGPGLGRALTRGLAAAAYRIAFRFADRVVFQNPDDEALMVQRRVLEDPAKAARVNGSGVDLEAFPQRPLPDGPPCFLMVARLLRDKGVYEYMAAARGVKAARPDARFLLVGAADDNPSAAKPEEIAAWAAEGVVEPLGRLDDVRDALAACQVFVLPSYREGTPRSALEALATGRPLIVADVPGCREVCATENGWRVPARNAAALADAMLEALADRARLARMAAASRRLAETRFEVSGVNRAMAALILGEAENAP